MTTDAQTRRLHDTADVVIDTILDLIVNHKGDKWAPGWSAKLLAHTPTNPSTGHVFTGGNWLIFSVMGIFNNYPTNWWCTLPQWNRLGNHIIKDSESTVGIRPVTHWKCTECDRLSSRPCEAHPQSVRSWTEFRVFYAYNLAQTHGEWVPPEATINDGVELVDEAELFVKRTGAEITWASQTPAYYPQSDTIRLANPGQYDTVGRYYSDLFHEIGHWTGHPSRLNRNDIGFLSKREYGQDEFVAEMTSATLCRRFGLEPTQMEDEHLEYLAYWLHEIQGEPQHLLDAAADAAKAYRWLMKTTATTP